MKATIRHLLSLITLVSLGVLCTVLIINNHQLSNTLESERVTVLQEMDRRITAVQDQLQNNYKQQLLDVEHEWEIMLEDKDEIIANLTDRLTTSEMTIMQLQQDAAASALVVSLTPEETELFAKLVYAEVGDQGIKCRMAVATVVINRMLSAKFANTLSGVIYEKHAFSTTSKLSSVTPIDMDYWAIELAIQHYGIYPTNMYYFNCHDFFSWGTDYQKIGTEYFSTDGPAEYIE